jgi:hypothetical protein
MRIDPNWKESKKGTDSWDRRKELWEREDNPADIYGHFTLIQISRASCALYPYSSSYGTSFVHTANRLLVSDILISTATQIP